MSAFGSSGNVGYKWAVYIAGGALGGVLGYQQYQNRAGGRADREALDGARQAERAQKEAQFEERVRAEKDAGLTRHSETARDGAPDLAAGAIGGYPAQTAPAPVDVGGEPGMGSKEEGGGVAWMQRGRV